MLTPGARADDSDCADDTAGKYELRSRFNREEGGAAVLPPRDTLKPIPLLPLTSRLWY